MHTKPEPSTLLAYFRAATAEEYVAMLEKPGFEGVKIIIFVDEECVRPHLKIEEKVRGRIRFAVICREKRVSTYDVSKTSVG